LVVIPLSRRGWRPLDLVDLVTARALERPGISMSPIKWNVARG
jgi:hypothetical protein